VAQPAAEVDGAVGRTFDERRWALDALSSLGDGVLIVDERARLVYFNPAAVRMVGANRLSSDPASWSAEYGIYAPDERTEMPPGQLPLVRALAGEPAQDVEIFVRNRTVPGGVHLSSSGFPLRDETGRVRGATVIFHDITARRNQQLQLQEAERQKRAILDNIPDIAWLKNREGRFVAVNTPLATSLGHKRPEDLIGLTDLDVAPRELAEQYRADDAEVMATRLPKRVEEQHFDATTGVTRWIETYKTCIVGDNGEVIGTTGIARDITKRKSAEQALRVTNDDLERRVALRTAELAEAQETLVRKERLAVLGQLAGGVAHQIRNPLAAIMNATYVLKRHLSPEQHPNVDDAIRIIHDEVRHANVIITGLLDYARVRTPDRHPASLVEVVERVLAAGGIPSSIIIERELDLVPLVEIDADQLHGAFFNLVRNAVEAMPDGGKLRVELRKEGDQILVAVTDSGPGISPQVRAHLFEPLHSTKPMGIGLGLVTARTFVEAHGGRITHRDGAPGARFEIRIPVR
jgi:PAS domain S-box-containing protein